MSIQIDFASLKSIRPHEYAVRFLFGGIVTVITGLIAIRFGPVIAGLFLAFPAIFPATATLIAKHEKQRKQQINSDGTSRGRSAAAIDAGGTSLGALALTTFALIVWHLLPHHSPLFVLPIAAITWMTISILLWKIQKRLP
jgi:hypothetical protein